MALLIRRRRLVLIAALLVMVGAGLVGSGASEKLTAGAHNDPSSESRRTAELLTRECRVHGMILVLTATGYLP